MKKLAISLVLSLCTLFSCAQNNTQSQDAFVKDNGVNDDLHRENIGKIKFVSKLFPYRNYKSGDFINSFEISDKNDFSIRAYFDKSLTNYMHELAPELTAEELTSKGNYQFSFYIDGELHYTENVNPGGGLPFQKNEFTVLYVPILSTGDAHYWSRFMWGRFTARQGIAEILESGTHTIKLEIRPYVKTDVVLVGDIMAEGEIELSLAERDPLPESVVAVQPVANNSGWEVSTDFDEEKIRQLNAKIGYQDYKNIASVVVIKDGKLVVEEYFNGANRKTLHDTRSVGKTFASTTMGIALSDGHIKSVNQTLGEFYDLKEFDSYSTKKAQVTLKSLLTMSSGFDGNDDNYNSPGNEEKMYPTSNWVKFTLDLGMDKNKEIGQTWSYFTAGVMLLGDILDKSVPGGLESYINDKLFKPLDITDYQWVYTPQKVPSTAGGLRLRALDFAKYGQLYQNKGMWRGKRVLSEEWVDKSHVNYFESTPDQTAYGLLFWRSIYTVNGVDYEAYECRGNGGNKVIVFKELPIVMVITATAYNQPYAHTQSHAMVRRFLLPAVLD